MIRAGELRTPLKLQRPNRTKSAAGGAAIPGWETIADLWGQVEGLSGGESIVADQVTANSSHRVTIRYREDIGHEMRLLASGRTLNIASIVDPDGLQVELIVGCIEAPDNQTR